MAGSVWHEERGRTFVAETMRFRMIAVWTADRRRARFFVWTRHAAAAATLVGSGTTADIGDAMRMAEQVAERAGNVAARTGHLVIVVDADNRERAEIAGALRGAGHDVAEVGSGEGALRRLERTMRPAVLVTEQDLGAGMSGSRLVATVGRLRPMTGILLIGDYIRSPRELTGHAFLAKPFSRDRLSERVGMIAESVRHSTIGALH